MPNVILIVTDDLGYADLSCYGSKTIKTPRLDQMADNGIRFTNFLQSSAQCTPSRASILTGCYPQRVSLEGVLLPQEQKGLHPDEITVAHQLKKAGYSTALVGKWHLGHHPVHNPRNHGFDTFYGIPYSNNMEPKVFYEDHKIIERDYDQATLTKRLTDRSLKWIDEQGEDPFFLCLWHPMPHMPLAATPEFLGTSDFGLYGDVVQEIDANVGRLLDFLKSRGLDDDTLVIFTSDNGPWQPRSKPDPNEGGSAYPLRGHKSNEFEGGLRVPCIAQWPGKIAPGQNSHTFWTGMDFFHTLSGLAGVQIANDRKRDGHDVTDILLGNSRESKYEEFFYYHYDQLNGVVSGDWKYMMPLTNRDEHFFYYKTDEAEALEVIGPPEDLAIPESLFNLKDDPSEQTNVIDMHPAIANDMRLRIERCRSDLGDKRINSQGANRRPALHATSDLPS